MNGMCSTYCMYKGIYFTFGLLPDFITERIISFLCIMII